MVFPVVSQALIWGDYGADPDRDYQGCGAGRI